ncbi:hypothetical protein NBH20_23750 [Rhizobium sp. S153]|uniref:Uncharacterized protein n=1 Tax=Ciceribacter sichuanensis TaxID=2949647 RepID=A0ABT0VIB8_9HYPH|nr:hypothetical protein [Ciceribacter sp. S153]MCM2404200.1 hypothetical protein [Ciceribacter sp. S153]
MAYVQTQTSRTQRSEARRSFLVWGEMCGIAAVVGSIAFVALLTIAL